MAAINDIHVEWRVVSRLHELLERLPETEHDVTLTYALFASTLCWTCQRLRETRVVGRHQDLWSELNAELAVQSPWNIDQLQPQKVNNTGNAALETLPANLLLVGLRNAIAHGDHRNVLPHHTVGRGADHELRGFKVTTSFKEKETEKKRVLRDWGDWTVILSRSEMRRIGLLISGRFVGALGKDRQNDAVRHVIGA